MALQPRRRPGSSRHGKRIPAISQTASLSSSSGGRSPLPPSLAPEAGEAQKYATYEDYLDSKLSETDMMFLPDPALARSLLEAGTLPNAPPVLSRADFDAAVRDRENLRSREPAPLPVIGCSDPYATLGSELLACVLSFLSVSDILTARTVSRGWADATLQPSAWTNPGATLKLSRFVCDDEIAELSILGLGHRVDLSGCAKLSDAGLSTLARAYTTNLTYISLCGCVGVTAVGLDALASECAQLRELNLFGCMSVDRVPCFPELAVINASWVPLDGAALSELTAMNKLENVSLANNGALDDRLLVAIGSACSSLACLDLTNCVNVTDSGLKALMFKCDKVRSLHLAGTAVTTATANTLSDGVTLHLFGL